MKDPWIGRASAFLIGGLSGAYLPEQYRLWAFGLLVLLGVRLVLWRPRDFFGRVFRPEIFLLGASLLLGFVYGGLADRALPEPISLDHVEIVGQMKDWNLSEDHAVGLVRVEESKGGTSKNTSEALADLSQEFKGETYRLTVYADKLGQIPGEWKRVQPGDLVSFQARLERPKTVGTTGAIDLRTYYGVRGLSGTLSAQGDAVLLTAGQSSLTWKIRQQVRSRLEVWDPEETGVLEGIFFGDSSRIDRKSVVRERV